jgi:hypothetical protein
VRVVSRRGREHPHGASLCGSIHGRRRNIPSTGGARRDAIGFGGGAMHL